MYITRPKYSEMTTLENILNCQRLVSVYNTTKNKYKYIKVPTQIAQMDYYK